MTCKKRKKELLQTHLKLSVMVTTAECVQGNFEGFPNRAQVVHDRLQCTKQQFLLIPGLKLDIFICVRVCNYLSSVYKRFSPVIIYSKNLQERV